MDTHEKAVILLSGGLDSSTTLAIARSQGYDIHAMSFDYGQRHARELEAAKAVAARMVVSRHIIAKIDLRSIGGSALTADIEVPSHRTSEEIGPDIPITYVPARNTIFLSFALAWAEVLGSFDIFIGVNAIDYSGYPDCRPEYIEAYEHMANLATKAGLSGRGRFKIHTPLINLRKAEIIRAGLDLGVDYSLTWSCYAPSREGTSCGVCDSCLLRLRGFEEARVRDPLPYSPAVT